MNLCDKILLEHFVNRSGGDAVWFLTHVQFKWEPAKEYLTRLQLAGFDRDRNLFAPMGVLNGWLDAEPFHGFTVFEIPHSKRPHDIIWNEATALNKKTHAVHKACVEGGFTPLFVTEHCRDGYVPTKIVVENESEGVIVSGLWTVS